MSKRINYSQHYSSDSFTIGDSYRFKFQRASYAATTLITLLYRFHYMGNWIIFSNSTVNIFHVVVTSACLFLPVLYMFLFIGHYSKLGCQAISRLMPVTCGVGYTMTIISVLELVIDVAVASDALEFFYLTIESGIEWIHCKPEWMEGCIGLNNVNTCRETGCFDNISQLSLYRYRVYGIRQLHIGSCTLNEFSDSRFWKHIEGSRIIFLLVCVIIVMLVCDLDISPNSKLSNIVVITYFSILLFFIIVLLTEMQTVHVVLDVFTVSMDVLIDYESWLICINNLLKGIPVVEVSAILIGSYLPSMAVTDLQAFIVWLGLMVLFILNEILACLITVSLSIKLGTTVDKVRKIPKYSTMHTMIIYPQMLGFSNVAPVTFTGLYFAMLFLSGLIRIKLLLTSIYHTVADYKPIIRAYKFYIRIFSCCFVFIVALPVYFAGIYIEFLILLRVLVACLSIVVLVMITVPVLYIYGVQTLCDDHHFTFGNQPAAFFKVTLFIVPVAFTVVAAFIFAWVTNGEFLNENPIAKSFFILFPIALIPQVIGLLFIMSYYLKRQHMAHLLRCEENWGDPNPNTRKERIIYHPRKETNYFRRIDVCKHVCLRYNKLFPLLIKNEYGYQRDTYTHLNAENRFYPLWEVGLPSSQSNSKPS